MLVMLLSPQPSRRLLVLLLIASGTVACSNILDLGGNDSPSPAAAASADGGSPKTNGDGAAAASSTSAALTAYCDSRKAFTSTCTQLDKCEVQKSTDCLDTFGVYSDTYLSARTKCGFPAQCPTPPATSLHDETVENCVSDEQDKVQPTDAMKSLATDLCAVCPNLHESTGGACLDNFWFHGRYTNGGVTVSGSGTVFDRYTDAMVAKIRTQCLPAAPSTEVSCWSQFYDCVDHNAVAAAQPLAVTKACAIGNATLPP